MMKRWIILSAKSKLPISNISKIGPAMKNPLLSFVVTLSFLIGSDSSFQEGVTAYESRAEKAGGMKAHPDQINKAIVAFKKAKENPNTELDAGVYLLKSYYYKGKYVAQDDETKKSVFNLGKALGEELIEKNPESAAVRYWYLVNLGSWAEVYGIIAAAREGVADLMREHSEKIIELDPEYSDGGGYFMLGAVHFKSPYIPFILSWPSNDDAVVFLTNAYETGVATPSQTVYLARALHKDGQKDQAKKLLKDLIALPLSETAPVEDSEQHQLAKGFLADWEK